jgi:hypothetical protein
MFVYIQSETTAPTGIIVFLNMTLPSDATIPACTKPQCLASKGIGTNSVTFSFVMGQPDIVGSTTFWHTGVYILVRSQNFAFAANGANLEGQLPAMSTSVPGQSVQQAPVFDFIYTISNPSAFDWIGGPTPTVERNRVDWSETAAAAAQGVAVSGVNRGAEATDSTHTFIAGLLAGIAGGAFIGFLQELLHFPTKDAGSDGSGEGQHRDQPPSRRPVVRRRQQRNVAIRRERGTLKGPKPEP